MASVIMAQQNAGARHAQKQPKAVATGAPTPGGGDDDADEDAYLATKPAHTKEIKEIFLYLIFMIMFTMYTVRGLQQEDIYYFGENLRGQLLGVEMKPEHSPTFNKNFEDVATVEEFYHWLLGPFSHTAFAVTNFDGLLGLDKDGRPAPLGPNGSSYSNAYKQFYDANGECLSETCGYTLGYGKIIGGIRISQVRSKEHDCSPNVYSVLSSNYKFNCTGLADNSILKLNPYGTYLAGNEDTSPFGNFTIHEPKPSPGCGQGSDCFQAKMDEWKNAPELYGSRAACLECAGTDPRHLSKHMGGESVETDWGRELEGFRYDGVVVKFRDKFNDTEMNAVLNPNSTDGSTATDYTDTVTSDVIYDLEPIPDFEKSVKYARSRYLSGFTSRKWNSYDAPAYAVVLPPTLRYAQAQKVIEDLYKSRYIDKQTRAVFVHMTVYNPMLDRICFIQIVGEMTTAGGVMPTHEFDIIRLWEVVTSTDEIYIALQACVAAFYLYYLWDMIPVLMKHGWAAFEDFLFCAQLANILFFIINTALIYAAEGFYPAFIEPNGPDFIEMTPSVRFKIVANSVGAVNVFLNWFKLISILSYDPQFGIVYNTLGRAASGVGGFLVIFLIIFYGFAQAHAMVFGGRLENFRTIGQSMFSLLRSLLGDFDFVQLQEAHGHMGPTLFILFVVLAVFVVLNILIAIISEAYDTCREEMKDYPPVNLTRELWQYFLSIIMSCDCFYKIIKCCCRKTYNRIHITNNKGDELDEEALEQAKMMAKSPIESAMEDAMKKMKSNSPSDLILVEWFDSLKQNEEDMANLQKDMTQMKLEIQGLSSRFTEQLDHITATAELLQQVADAARGRKSPSAAVLEDPLIPEEGEGGSAGAE